MTPKIIKTATITIKSVEDAKDEAGKEYRVITDTADKTWKIRHSAKLVSGQTVKLQIAEHDGKKYVAAIKPVSLSLPKLIPGKTNKPAAQSISNGFLVSNTYSEQVSIEAQVAVKAITDRECAGKTISKEERKLRNQWIIKSLKRVLEVTE